MEIKLLKIGSMWKERRNGERGGGRRMRGEECVCVYERDWGEMYSKINNMDLEYTVIQNQQQKTNTQFFKNKPEVKSASDITLNKQTNYNFWSSDLFSRDKDTVPIIHIKYYEISHIKNPPQSLKHSLE